jgi:ParB family transcriptional regulator, chromosome partitioning protein
MNDPDDEDDARDAQETGAEGIDLPESDSATGWTNADDSLPAWPFPTAASVPDTEVMQHSA